MTIKEKLQQYTQAKLNKFRSMGDVDTAGSLANRFWQSKAANNLASWQTLLSDPKSKIKFGQDYRYNPQDTRRQKANKWADNVIKNAGESIVTMIPKVGYDIGQLGKGIVKGNTNDIKFTSAPARFGEDFSSYFATEDGTRNTPTIRKPFDTVGFHKGQGRWNVPFTQIKLPELGFTESSAFSTGVKGLEAFEAPLAAKGLLNPLKLLTMAGFSSTIGGAANYVGSGAKKGSFEEGAWQTAYNMAPTVAKSSGLLSSTDKLTTLGNIPMQSLTNVLQGIAYDKMSGTETTGGSIFIDALFPIASDVSGKAFKSFTEAAKTIQGKVLTRLGKHLRKSDGTYTTLAKWVKGTRPYRKGSAGALFGFEIYQDEDGTWKVSFNNEKALLGIALMSGGTKALKNLDSKSLGDMGTGKGDMGTGKNELEDILKAQEIKGQTGDLLSDTTKPYITLDRDIQLKKGVGGDAPNINRMAWGEHFTDNTKLAQEYGTVIDGEKLPKGTKVANLDYLKIKYAQNSKLADPKKISKELMDKGYKYAKGTMPTGDIEFIKLGGSRRGWDAMSDWMPGEPISVKGKYAVLDELDDMGEATGKFTLAEEGKGTIKTFNSINDAQKYGDTLVNKVGSGVKNRGLAESVQASSKITKPTKIKVGGTYKVKTNTDLMGEAKALLVEGGSIDFKNTKNLDQKVAATIEQARILDARGDHKAAANLFNNLSEHATELGRGVQAFNLLDKMSPEAVSLSAAGKIKKYNLTAKKPIPELTGEQQKQISDAVEKIRNMPDGRDKNIAIRELDDKINSFIPSSLADKVIAVWKAGLLTSLRTHERNIIGNTMMLGSELSTKPVVSAADWLMSKRTGQRTQTTTFKGLGEFGSAKTRQQISDLVKRGYDPSQEISKYEIKKVNWKNNPVEQALKKYTDSVFRVLSAEDKPFYNAMFKNSLYDQAGAIAKNAGKSGDTSYIKSLVDNPTDDMLTTAIADANYATFHDKNALSNAATAIKRGMGKSEWGKLPAEITMPFTSVPSSMVGKTIAYSPIGLVRGSADMGRVLIKNMPELQRQAAQEIGRGTMGTAIFTLGAYLMSKGLMTGQPKDEKERNQWQLEGKQANSIFVNGKWRSINSVGPQTLVLLAGAKYNQEMNSKEGSLGSYLGNLGRDQLNQTFLQGMMGPLNAINDPTRYGKSWTGNTLSSGVPNIIKDTSKAVDPTARETNTWWEYPMAGIPGLRNTLLPRRDVLGNIIPQEPTGVKAYYDLFNSKTPISNVVVDELARLNNEGSNATPSKLQKNQTINKVKMKLTPEELDMLESTIGDMLNPALEKLITSQSYQLLDDEKKAKAIDNLVADIRSKAKSKAGVLGMPDTGYVSSKDAPKTLTDKLSVYGSAVLKDPKKTVKAVIDGQPIRKIVGDSVILERQNNLSVLDNGNKETVVDHVIPLSLGGTNDKSNLQYITANENIAKSKVEMQILKDLKAGKINEKEAQKRIKDWKSQLNTLPDEVNKEILSEMVTRGGDKEAEDEDVSLTMKRIKEEGGTAVVGNYFIYRDAETNSSKKINITPDLSPPKLTGQSTLDKKILSDYKSKISSRITDIRKLYENGYTSAQGANKEIEKLERLKKEVSNLTNKGKAAASKKKKLKFKPTKIKLKLADVSFEDIGRFNVKKLHIPKPNVSEADLEKLRTGNV